MSSDGPPLPLRRNLGNTSCKSIKNHVFKLSKYMRNSDDLHCAKNIRIRDFIFRITYAFRQLSGFVSYTENEIPFSDVFRAATKSKLCNKLSYTIMLIFNSIAFFKKIHHLPLLNPNRVNYHFQKFEVDRDRKSVV